MNPLFLWLNKQNAISVRYSGKDRTGILTIQQGSNTLSFEVDPKSLLEIENGLKSARQELFKIHLGD